MFPILNQHNGIVTETMLNSIIKEISADSIFNYTHPFYFYSHFRLLKTDISKSILGKSRIFLIDASVFLYCEISSAIINLNPGSDFVIILQAASANRSTFANHMKQDCRLVYLAKFNIYN